jgi:hypothetical protein
MIQHPSLLSRGVWEKLIAVEAFDGSQCIVSGLVGKELCGGCTA